MPPHGEDKLVRCTAGAIFDVAVDLRPESPTRYQWNGFELTAENRRMMYVPQGMAHGFITLRDDTELQYFISTPYVPDAARGVRWDDPLIGIGWPLQPTTMSDRDATYPDLSG